MSTVDNPGCSAFSYANDETGDEKMGFCAVNIMTPSPSLPSEPDLLVGLSSNSPPGLSNRSTTSSENCMSVKTDLSKELECALCKLLFERPVMVACGHSFCESCIEHYTRTRQDCAICGDDVGELQAMIPSISLLNIVHKYKHSQECSEALYTCEEESLQMEKARQHCFFSIAAPKICASPMPVKRHDPPPPGAVPGKSSLKTQNSPTSTNSSEQSGRSFSPFKSLNARRTSSSTHSPQPFRRNSFGRQSERFTRSTTARPSLAAALDSFTLPANNTSNAPVLVRNSLLRRSLNALKRKATRQQSYSVTAVVAANPSPKMASEEADEKAKLLPNTEIAKPFWKRLFVNNKRNNSQQLSTVPEIGESKNFKIKAPFLAGYKGNGKSFEKIGRGEEITLVLFGHPKCGKTSFVNAIKEAFTRPAILVGPGFSVPRTLTLNDRFGLVGYSESDNCLPSLVPLLLNVDGKNVYVDVIEGEYVHEECASSPYAAAADAAILMLDSTTCASLLSAHQVQRCLARVQHDLGTSVEYSVVVNKVRSVPEAIQRALSESECANLARSLRTTHWEIDTAKGDFDALLAAEMIWSLCSQVLRRRAAADAKIVKESQLV